MAGGNGIGGNDFQKSLRNIFSSINSDKAKELTNEEIDKIYKTADEADKTADGKISYQNLFNTFNSMYNLETNIEDVESDYLNAFSQVAGNNKVLSTENTNSSATVTDISLLTGNERKIAEKRLAFQKDIMEAETKLSEAQTYLNELISGQNEDLRAAKENVDALHIIYERAVGSTNKSLAAQIATNKSDIDEAETALDKVESEIEIQKEAISRRNILEQRLNSLGDDADSSEINNLKAEIQECINIESQADTTIGDIDKQLSSLSIQKTQAETTLNNVNSIKKGLDEQAKTQSTDIAELLKNYQDSKDDYKTLKNNKIKKAKENVNSAKKELDSLKSEFSDFENEITKAGQVVPQVASSGAKCDLASYNGDFGSKLVSYTQSHLRGTVGHCAGGVSDTIAALLGNGPQDTNWRLNCDAWQAGDVLSNSKFSQYFTEVTGQYTKDDIKNLPAGAIVVFGKNSSKQYGHICIMDGQGNQMSDWKGEYNPSYYENNFFSKGSSLRIFLPKN